MILSSSHSPAGAGTRAVFGDDRIWIGFPAPDTSPGHALHLSNVYAVTSRFRAAEGAWEFIEGYIDMDY